MMVGACMHARILRKPIFDRINTDLCKQTLILQYYYFEISGIGTLLQLAPAHDVDASWLPEGRQLAALP